MAAKEHSSTTSAPEGSFGREDFPDFALVLKDGHELKCHKVKLAEVSLVFCAMLRQDCVETKSNKMKITEIDRVTVESFLDYIYADLELDAEQDMYKKKFDKKSLTPELLKMSHMYQVQNLQVKCVKYLMKNIEDNNAVDIWNVAEMISNEELREVALDHLIKKGDKLAEVTGLKQSFQSPQLAESIVLYLSARIASPSPTVNDEIITVIVVSSHIISTTRKIHVKLSDTVKVLRLLFDKELAVPSRTDVGAFPSYKCQEGSLTANGLSLDDEQRTLASYGLYDQCTIRCQITSLYD